MIASASARDGVSLQRAQTGRRLARVGDARARSGNQIDEGTGRGCDSAQPAEQIQRGSLAGENRSRACRDFRPRPRRLRRVRLRPTRADVFAPSSSSENARNATGNPATIPPRRATIRAVAVRSGSTIASVVRSPPRPTSSSNAARTIGSAISSSDAWQPRKGTLREGFIGLRIVASIVAAAALAAR